MSPKMNKKGLNRVIYGEEISFSKPHSLSSVTWTNTFLWFWVYAQLDYDSNSDVLVIKLKIFVKMLPKKEERLNITILIANWIIK